MTKGLKLRRILLADQGFAMLLHNQVQRCVLRLAVTVGGNICNSYEGTGSVQE